MPHHTSHTTPTTLILWDIDGTLLLTGGAGDRAMQKAFQIVYQRNVEFEIKPHGKTDPQIISEIYQSLFESLPDNPEIEKIKEAYLRIFEQEIALSEKFYVMPHVRETIARLSSNPRIVQGLATGNYEASSYMKLKRAGIDSFFKFGGFGDDAYDRQKMTHMALQRGIKHLGEQPSHVYLIGDTVNDIRCGKGIGATTIGVCTCTTPREDLEKAGADYVLKDLSEMAFLP